MRFNYGGVFQRKSAKHSFENALLVRCHFSRIPQIGLMSVARWVSNLYNLHFLLESHRPQPDPVNSYRDANTMQMTGSSSKLLQIQGKWYWERKPKNIQNLRPKIPKTILHPFRAAEWLAPKAKRLCPYRWHFNVEWKTMENQCLSFRVVHFKTFASLQPSILVADFSLPQQSLPFLWPLFEQVGFLRSGLPLPPDISRNLQNAAGQPHQSFPRSWNRPQDSRGGGGGYGGYGLLLQCCDIEHCRNCCENCTELWLSARPGTKSLNNQLEG